MVTIKHVIAVIVIAVAYLVYVNIDTIIESLKVIAVCIFVIVLLKFINFFGVINAK